LDWLALTTTGSVTRINTHVRKYSAGSVRSGVLEPRRKSTLKTPPVPNPISEKKKKSRGSKLSNTSRSNDTKDIPFPEKLSSRASIIMVPDSPKMQEFFDEVRMRELKEYYKKMKASQRPSKFCIRKNSVCHTCGLRKRNKLDISQNIYCTGAESMGQSLKGTNRSRESKDRTSLWSSFALLPRS
ncbi:hypothetical protein KR018_009106, partial [Drosophila ironensis]